jgi:hypothetical protein
MIQGIKGKSLVVDLKYYLPLENTNIDSMHSVFYGVLKHLFKYWFEHPSDEKYSFKRYLVTIEARLEKVRPPSFIAQAPRKIKDWRTWSCHEFMNFILYYAQVVFYKLIPEQYYENIVLLVVALESLFSRQIPIAKLHFINQLLVDFLDGLENLYDIRIYNSGVHELCHLVRCTAYFGPLYLMSCFQFEGNL